MDGKYLEPIETVFGITTGEIPELKRKAELGEHYKHLYSEVKKQKDDVVEYIKNNMNYYYDEDLEESIYQDEISGNKVLRMLGETDVED